MKDSRNRVRRLLAGEKPDRPPLFDLFANDAVYRYFNGGCPVEIDDEQAGIAALSKAVDASRYGLFCPLAERTITLPDGRIQKCERWTCWTGRRAFASVDEYRRVKKTELSGPSCGCSGGTVPPDDLSYHQQRRWNASFGDDFCFLLFAPSPELMVIHTEIGLETFSFYLYDAEDCIIDQLERNTANACRWARALPDDDPFECVFIGEDIAFKGGPMINPAWLRKHYFPRLARVIAAFHETGRRVMFHSDGNLNLIMDDLVEAGIDVLNPIEIQAGMDLADLHRRYPRLFFAGGIDVSRLLPRGKPQEVRDAVVKAVDDTEGRILIGSCTEVGNDIPLDNFLAMRDAAIDYRY